MSDNKQNGSDLSRAVMRGEIDRVLSLLDQGADVNSTTSTGATLLYIACKNGHKEIVLMLLDRGADVNQAMNQGYCSLHVACIEGNKEIALILLDRGADIEQADNRGRTSLWVTCQSGHKDIAAILLDRGAEVKLTIRCRNEVWFPLRVACYGNHTDLATMLIERGADNDGFLFKAQKDELTLFTWREARARMALRIKQVDLLTHLSQSDPLPLPTVLVTIVQEYILYSPGLDREEYLK